MATNHRFPPTEMNAKTLASSSAFLDPGTQYWIAKRIHGDDDGAIGRTHQLED